MGRFRWACLCVAIAASNATAATAGKNVDTDIRQAVQAFMQEYKIPGVTVAITVNGKEQFYNFGVVSRETQKPVTSDTLFEIGSISKTFTATLASYAQVNRQLALGDHPGKYFSELQGTDFDKVTLLNLGTHTAGGFPLQVPDEIQNTTQLMAYFKAWKPQYAAGSQRTYANPSVGMLGLITAKSMRMPFDTAMEQVLLPKLGMSNTYLHVPTDKMALYAQGYNSKNQPVRVSPGMLWEEAYGIKTSAKDLLRFVDINLGSIDVEPKLKEAIADTHIGYFKLNAMTQDLIWEQFAYPVSQRDFLEASSDKVVFQNNIVEPWHPALAPRQNALINKTGSTAGFGAYIAFIPSRKIGIVLLTNRSNPMDGRLRLVYRILRLVDTAPN